MVAKDFSTEKCIIKIPFSGEGPLGHPRVWLQIPEDLGWVECPYCDCKYIHKDFEGKV